MNKRPPISENNEVEKKKSKKVEPMKPAPTTKITFDQVKNGSDFEDLSDVKLNDADFVVYGLSNLPKSDAENRPYAFLRIYVKDVKNRVGEINLNAKIPVFEPKFAIGDVVNLKQFAVKKSHDEEYHIGYELELDSIENITKLDRYIPLELGRSPNTLDEMNYALSNCCLRFINSTPIRHFASGGTVTNLIFETFDGKKVQLTFWNQNVIQVENLVMEEYKWYKIINATRAKNSQYSDFCIVGHETTEIEEIDIQEIDDEEPGVAEHPIAKFTDITEEMYNKWKFGRNITAISDAVEDKKKRLWNQGITDGSRNTEGKLMAMVATYNSDETPIKKGTLFNSHLKMMMKDNGRITATITHIETLGESTVSLNKIKFI